VFWVVLIIICALIAAGLESLPGKLVAGSITLAIGCLLLRWITGVAVFVVIAKACAVAIVVILVGGILLALFAG